jgi:4-amino-4-deoxy-L-arabinose transferase-like glycosyltransferase
MGPLLSRPLLALCLLGAALGVVGLGNHELWTADEPRVAGIGREMWQSGQWAVPRLSGVAFLEKPPLYWWAEAAVFEAAGRASAGLARVPSALFGFATLLLTYAWGRRAFSPTACGLGGLVLLTTAHFVIRSHWAIVDPALLCGTTGALACFAHAEAREGRGRGALLAGMYAWLALAFLAKGVVGLGIPALGIGTCLVWSRRVRAFAGWHLVVGGVAVAAVVGLWLWRVGVAEGETGLRTFLVYNQLGRFLPSEGSYEGAHLRPFYYYLRQGPADLMPWTPIVLLAAWSAWRRWGELGERERAGIRLLVAASVPVVAALSLAGTKRGLYLLPIAPPLALLAGWWMAGEPREDAGLEGRLGRIWGRVVVAAALVLPALALLADVAWWRAVAIATAGLLALGLGLRALPAPTPATRWLRILVFACAGWAAFLALWPRARDPYHTLRPAADQVERLVPADATLYAYDPSETTRGIVAFYTGRPLVPIPDLAAVRALARREPGAWVLVDGKKGEGDYADLVDSGIPHEIRASVVIRAGREVYLVTLGECCGSAAP